MDQALQFIGGFGPPTAAVTGEADPARARGQCRETVRKRHAQLPRAVATHGMSGQIRAGPIRAVLLLDEFEDLDGIAASPVLPIEAVGTTVGRRSHMHPGLGRIARGLTGGLDARAVRAEHEAGT